MGEGMELSANPRGRAAEDPDFPGYGFKDSIPHKGGDILFEDLGNDRFRWAIRTGSSYEPERHPHGHTLHIEQGKGVVSIDGKEHPYSAGQEFDIHGSVAHGFIQVDEPTVVLQTPLKE